MDTECERGCTIDNDAEAPREAPAGSTGGVQIGGAVIRERDIDDYTRMKRNPNKGSARGKRMITDSFKRNKSGRPILSDGDDELIAGNHAIQGAAEAGIRKVIEIETTGDVLIVHKRADLDLDSTTDTRARDLAYADNQTSLADITLDAVVLLEDMASGLDLTHLFRGDELEELLADAAAAQTVEDAERAGAGSSEPKMKPLAGVRVKVVMIAPDVKLVERAISATGIMNRGEALTAICRHYLDHNPSTETTGGEK